MHLLARHGEMYGYEIMQTVEMKSAGKIRLAFGSLELYLHIVSNVSEYRYSSYAPAEAAYSIESAFYAGEILEQKGQSEQAHELYKSIVRRMEYEEARLSLNDYYKRVKLKLGLD